MLIKYIIDDNYRLSESLGMIETLDGYSNVFFEPRDETDIIVKALDMTELKRDLLEKVYDMYRDLEYVHSPVRNIHGRNITFIDGRGYVVFKKIEEIISLPDQRWWGKTISELHKISFLESATENKIHFNKEYGIIKRMMNPIIECIPCDIQEMLNDMIYGVDWNEEYSIPFIVNHGDLLLPNLMCEKGNYKIIDFERACFAPKEYDVQRHLWDVAMRNIFNNTIGDYCDVFWNEYELSNSFRLNNKLMVDLYVVDFIKTILWLYSVCKNDNRVDIKRQIGEKELFEQALRVGNVQKMLECIKERG